MAKRIARSHHEHYDGTGYPDQLEGIEIPLEARITAVADVYDAIRTKRPYKEKKSHKYASDYIRNESGKHFDSILVNAFIKIENEFIRISEVYEEN